jgi:hypothetical protein
MTYIKVERDANDSSSWTKFDCKLCDFHIPSGGCHGNMNIMQRHVEEQHRGQWKRICYEKEQYKKELEAFNARMDKKYPLRNRTIGSFFKGLPLPPKRMWKCDRCGKVMSPSDRRYHENNADKYCKPRMEAKSE